LKIGSYCNVGYGCVTREELCGRTYLKTLEVVIMAKNFLSHLD
jgi:hypothetical protein